MNLLQVPAGTGWEMRYAMWIAGRRYLSVRHCSGIYWGETIDITTIGVHDFLGTSQFCAIYDLHTSIYISNWNNINIDFSVILKLRTDICRASIKSGNSLNSMSTY